MNPGNKTHIFTQTQSCIASFCSRQGAALSGFVGIIVQLADLLCFIFFFRNWVNAARL